jgi:lipoate synthase
VIPYILSSPSASARLLKTHAAESFGLDGKMRRIVRVKQLSARGGEMSVCWNQEEGTVRIMGECCSLGQKEVDVEV